MKTLLPLLIVLVGCSQPADPRPAAFLDPDALRWRPRISTVEVTPAKGKPTRQIIHILDFHYVEEKIHEIDIRDAAKADGVTLTDEQVLADWELFISQVDEVQQEQMTVLRSLVKSNGLKSVYSERFTPEDMPHLPELLGHLKRWRKREGDSLMDQFLNDMHRNDVLLVGAAGRMMMEGEIEMLPAEDKELLDAADPVKGDKVEFDQKATKRRLDAIARNVLASESPVVVLVLGGSHDLAGSVPENVEVVRVGVGAYWRAIGE